MLKLAIRTVVKLIWRTPADWYKPQPRLPSLTLRMAGIIYSLAVDWSRRRQSGECLPIPVVSVGNLTLGGTGKTPLVIALARELQRRGFRVAVLLRGYGSSSRISCKVQAHHDAAKAGDEALEYRAALPNTPVWIGPNRVASARAAIAAGANLLLLDDGLQHWQLARDIDISVLDKSHGIGNGLVFPAGPLRESASHLGRADILVITGTGSLAPRPLPWPDNKPTFHLSSWIVPPPGITDQPLLAFCGIGLPCKFFAALEEANLQVVEQHSFPDHYPYSHKELVHLKQRAMKLNARLATTSKDWQRLPPNWQEMVVKLPVELDQRVVSSISDIVEHRVRQKLNG